MESPWYSLMTNVSVVAFVVRFLFHSLVVYAPRRTGADASWLP